MKPFLVAILAFSGLILLTSAVTYAADTTGSYQPLTGIYGITDSVAGETGDQRLSRMIQNAFNLLIGFAGLAAVIMISYGAIEYMMSESIMSKGAGREKMFNAVIGLLLVLFTYTILYTINPDLLSIRIAVKNLGISGEGTTIADGNGTISQIIADTAAARTTCKKEGGDVIEPQTAGESVMCQKKVATLTNNERLYGHSGNIISNTNNAWWCVGASAPEKLSNSQIQCSEKGGIWVNPVQYTAQQVDIKTNQTTTHKWYVGHCSEKKTFTVSQATADRAIAEYGNNSWTSPYTIVKMEPAYDSFLNSCPSGSLSTVKNTEALNSEILFGGNHELRNYYKTATWRCSAGASPNISQCLPKGNFKR